MNVMTAKTSLFSPFLFQGSRTNQLAIGGTLFLIMLAALRLWPDINALSQSDATMPDGQVARLLLYELRLPRVLAALVSGAALGLSGALFQALTRNPLAAPDLLGVTGGAQLGVFAAIMLPALGGVANAYYGTRGYRAQRGFIVGVVALGAFRFCALLYTAFLVL